MQATPSPDPTSTSTGTSTSTDTGTGTGTGTSTTITTSTGTSTSEAETIAICVKRVSGKFAALEVAKDTTSGNLKSLIDQNQCLPVENHCVLFNSVQLEDGLRLCDYGIQNRSTFYVILCLRGGGAGSSVMPIQGSAQLGLQDYASALPTASDSDVLTALNALPASMREELTEVVKSITNLLEDSNAQQNENAALREDNAALQNENAALRQDNAALQNENTALREELVALRNANSALLEQAAGVVKDNAAQQDENAAPREEYSQQEYDQLNAECSGFRYCLLLLPTV